MFQGFRQRACLYHTNFEYFLVIFGTYTVRIFIRNFSIFSDRGRYFWYKISSDMRCQDFLPFYVIYDKYGSGGRLNAWGFYLPGFKDGWSSQKGKKMDGPYWMQKHTGVSFKSLFKEKTYPKCTKDLPNYTKQIFMKKVNVWNYGCRKIV